MKAMILAAGEGTRLHPLTYNFPKPMVPVVNTPVMEHILLWLSSFGIREVVVNTHHEAGKIESHFQDGKKHGMKIHYSREEKLKGTAGGVKHASAHFNETFLVIGGDDLSDVNLDALIQAHRKSKALATIGLKEVERTEHYGVVITGENGKVIRFQEKPKTSEALSNMANTGIYLFEPEIFQLIPEGEVFDFGRQLFPLLLEKKASFHAFPVDGYWMDVGTLGEYKESHWAILEKRCRVKIPGKEISPGIWVEEDVSISPAATIHPPCALGRGTIVEDEAHLAGFVVAGRRCRISKGARLERVILWDDAMASERTILNDGVLTPEVAAFRV